MTDEIYTYKTAKDLNRKEQVKVLKDRKITVMFIDKEDDLIKKILASNPILTRVGPTIAKEEEPVEKPKVKEVPKVKDLKQGPICDRCGESMRQTGGGPSGVDYHCDKCGYNQTREI